MFTVFKSQTSQAGGLSLAGSGSGQGQGDRVKLVQEGTLWSGSGTCAGSKLALSFSSQTLRRKDTFRALTPVNSFVAQMERILLVCLLYLWKFIAVSFWFVFFFLNSGDLPDEKEPTCFSFHLFTLHLHLFALQICVRWDPEQTDLLGGILSWGGRGAGTGQSLRSLLTQAVLWFCDTLIYVL